jgi:hypothetical protein
MPDGLRLLERMERYAILKKHIVKNIKFSKHFIVQTSDKLDRIYSRLVTLTSIEYNCAGSQIDL